MQKILFVITKSNWGGAQRYIFDLATNLSKKNWEVKVALGGEGLLKQKLEENNVPVIQIPHLQRDISLLKELVSFFSLIKIFKNERPNIIHLNSTKAGGLGAVAALVYKILISRAFKFSEVSLPKIKTIFTVHGWAFNEARNFSQKIAIYLSQWITSFLCDRTIVLSRHDYRQALGMPLIKQEKFALIPLGIPERDLKYLPKPKAEKELNLSQTEKLRVGTIAEFTKNKGLNFLLDAIKKLEPERFELAIVGDGEEKERIEKRIEDENLKEKVTVCGFVPNAAKYIKAFDIFVLPSLKEGLPYTILEAMNAGVPVVASSVGGIPDLIEHEKSGFLTIPASSQSLTETLEKLVSDEKLYHQFSRESKKRALEKFSFASMLKRTIDLYLSEN